MSAGDLLRRRLLVVDDEEMILSLLKSWLERETHFECEFFSSGEAALAFYEDKGCDVLLTDIRMPGMDGIELLRSIKQVDRDVAVIVMSGYSEVNSVIEALREGVVDFFKKPFEMRSVIDCLNRTFQRLNVEYSRQEAISYLASESQTFRIPNSFDAADQVALDLTRQLAEKDFTDDAIIESVRVSLNEMIINAIEHGNLEVSYEEKSRIIEDFEAYGAFLKKRAEQPRFRDRRVEIEYSMTADAITFVVRDQGDGFDHDNLPDPTDPENLLNCHGRGILMTTIYMDEVRYNEKGNEVTLVKYANDPTLSEE